MSGVDSFSNTHATLRANSPHRARDIRSSTNQKRVTGPELFSNMSFISCRGNPSRPNDYSTWGVAWVILPPWRDGPGSALSAAPFTWSLGAGHSKGGWCTGATRGGRDSCPLHSLSAPAAALERCPLWPVIQLAVRMEC